MIIYDILGREIQTLVNEQQNPGIYEVTFDAGNLPSGVYYYRLKVGDPSTSLPAGETGSGQDFIETNRMVLLK